MKLCDFIKKLCTALEKEMGEGCKLELKEVQKNNGVVLHGLMLQAEGRKVVPTIYLEPFWRAYEEGATFSQIVESASRICRRESRERNFDVGFFCCFEKVQQGICYELIGKKDNAALLQNIPHIDFLDMAICFYYACRGTELGQASILIRNTHMDMWGTDTAKLLELAKQNTERLFPAQLLSMGELTRELADDGQEIATEAVKKGAAGEKTAGKGMAGQKMTGKDAVWESDWRDTGGEAEECRRILAEVPMKVLSNVSRCRGAACILYEDTLRRAAEEYGEDFYILPSSVHEVILFPVSEEKHPERLRDIVREVNRTQILPEEVLSDNVYYYRRKERKIQAFFSDL